MSQSFAKTIIYILSSTSISKNLYQEDGEKVYILEPHAEVQLFVQLSAIFIENIYLFFIIAYFFSSKPVKYTK